MTDCGFQITKHAQNVHLESNQIKKNTNWCKRSKFRHSISLGQHIHCKYTMAKSYPKICQVFCVWLPCLVFFSSVFICPFRLHSILSSICVNTDTCTVKHSVDLRLLLLFALVTLVSLFFCPTKQRGGCGTITQFTETDTA